MERYISRSLPSILWMSVKLATRGIVYSIEIPNVGEPSRIALHYPRTFVAIHISVPENVQGRTSEFRDFAALALPYVTTFNEQ